MTTATTPPVRLDDSRVQARVAEKARDHQAKTAEHESAVLSTAQTVGRWTFYPPNSCTLDAIFQPDILAMSQVRVRILLGYLMTLEPAEQIPAAADVLKLRTAAAEWQDEIPAEQMPEVVRIINAGYEWLQNRTTQDTAFFFTP